MSTGLSAPPALAIPQRSDADRTMRRLLGLPVDAPKQSIFGAQQAFSRSIWISATRCLITYIALPLLRPVLGITGTLGPVLGLVVGAVSMVAIFFALRRFFAADHRYRWRYAAVAGAVAVLLTVQAALDVIELAF
jgi:hypothetical protein